MTVSSSPQFGDRTTVVQPLPTSTLRLKDPEKKLNDLSQTVALSVNRFTLGLSASNLLSLPDPLAAFRDASVDEKQRHLARDLKNLLNHTCLHKAVKKQDDSCLGFFGGYLINLFLPSEKRISAMKSAADSVQQLANFLLVSSAVLRGAQVTAGGALNKPGKNLNNDDAERVLYDSVELFLGIWNFTSMTVLLYAMMLAFHVKQAVCYDDARRSTSSRAAHSSLIHDAGLLRSLGKARFFQGFGFFMVLVSTPFSIMLLPCAIEIRCCLVLVWGMVFHSLEYSSALVLLETSPLALRHYPYLSLGNISGALMRRALITPDELRRRAALQTRELLSHDLAGCEDTAFFLLRWCPEVLEAWAQEETVVVRAEQDEREEKTELGLADSQWGAHSCRQTTPGADATGGGGAGEDSDDNGYGFQDWDEEQELLGEGKTEVMARQGPTKGTSLEAPPSLVGFLAEHGSGAVAALAEDLLEVHQCASVRSSVREGVAEN